MKLFNVMALVSCRRSSSVSIRVCLSPFKITLVQWEAKGDPAERFNRKNWRISTVNDFPYTEHIDSYTVDSNEWNNYVRHTPLNSTFLTAALTDLRTSCVNLTLAGRCVWICKRKNTRKSVIDASAPSDRSQGNCIISWQIICTSYITAPGSLHIPLRSICCKLKNWSLLSFHSA